MRDFLRGSLISDTHFPHARIRTPRYDGAAGADVSASRGRFRLLLLLQCCFLPPVSSALGEHEDAEQDDV
jgi:hypothetical protein